MAHKRNEKFLHLIGFDIALWELQTHLKLFSIYFLIFNIFKSKYILENLFNGKTLLHERFAQFVNQQESIPNDSYSLVQVKNESIKVNRISFWFRPLIHAILKTEYKLYQFCILESELEKVNQISHKFLTVSTTSLFQIIEFCHALRGTFSDLVENLYINTFLNKFLNFWVSIIFEFDATTINV